jgi:hypothetical protein
MKHTIEEALLLLVAAGMLSFLLPVSTVWGIVLSVTLAIVLIILLAVRGVGWHHVATPYDLLIIAGAAASLIYLASFSALLQGVLSAILAVLFTAYFLLLAGLLHTFHATPAGIRTAPRVKFYSHVNHAEDQKFMRGVKPIPEAEPPFANLTKKQAVVHAHMARHGIEPIHEITPRAAKTHAKNFRKGIASLKESKKLPWEK